MHNGQDAPPRRPGGQQAQLQKKPGGKMNGVESTNGGSRTFQVQMAIYRRLHEIFEQFFFFIFH